MKEVQGEQLNTQKKTQILCHLQCEDVNAICEDVNTIGMPYDFILMIEMNF